MWVGYKGNFENCGGYGCILTGLSGESGVRIFCNAEFDSHTTAVCEATAQGLIKWKASVNQGILALSKETFLHVVGGRP
jgi:hypothetical protein